MRRLGTTVLALGGLWFVVDGQAQEAEQAPAPVPDLDFLEYLGAWAGEDDEWLAIEQWQKDNGDPDGENADEDDDKPESEDDERE